MIAGLSEEQAGSRLYEGTWSVAEVLDHILRAEMTFGQYQREALERAVGGQSAGTIRDRFRGGQYALCGPPRQLDADVNASSVRPAAAQATPFQSVRLAVMA